MRYDPEFPIPNGGYRTKEVRVAYGSYQDIELCYLLYKISEYTDYSYSKMEVRPLTNSILKSLVR